MRILACFIKLLSPTFSLQNTVKITLPSHWHHNSSLSVCKTGSGWKVFEKYKPDLTPFRGFLWFSTFLEISQLFKRITRSESLQQQEVGIGDPEGSSSPVFLEGFFFPSHTKDVKDCLCGLDLTFLIHTPCWNFLFHQLNRAEVGEG